jgi:hypothetical protein
MCRRVLKLFGSFHFFYLYGPVASLTLLQPFWLAIGRHNEEVGVQREPSLFFLHGEGQFISLLKKRLAKKTKQKRITIINKNIRPFLVAEYNTYRHSLWRNSRKYVYFKKRQKLKTFCHRVQALRYRYTPRITVDCPTSMPHVPNGKLVFLEVILK